MIEQHRVAVITGATGNLGPVVANALALQGLRLGLISTNMQRLRTLAERLQMPDDRLVASALDLTKPEDVQAAAGRVLESFHRVDILLHLVGGWSGGKSVAEVAATDMSNMLNQHLWTTFHLAQAFLPHLVSNGWGRMIVVSSPLASNPPAKMAAYAAAKAAQEALVLAIARETAGTGVTANILQVRAIDAKHERESNPKPENAHWTTPEEITAAILYLCSDEAGVVTGARIPLFT
jgi:NAD(P)-dependent dehydrogenase (short-subunit alcohol dehydrogenase family)